MKSFFSGLKRVASMDAAQFHDAQGLARSSTVSVDLGVVGAVIGRHALCLDASDGLPDKVRAFVAHCEMAGLGETPAPDERLRAILAQMIASPQTEPAVFLGGVVLESFGLLPDFPGGEDGWAVYLATAKVAATHDARAHRMRLAEKFQALLEVAGGLHQDLLMPMSDALLQAVRGDCGEALRAMIEAGVNLEPGDRGWGPLHVAVRADAPGALGVLIEHLGLGTAFGPGGRTLVHLAALEGHMRALAVLLRDPRVDLESRSTRGATALHYACANGRVEAVQCLVRAGARIDARQDGGATPLHLAAERGNIAMVVALLNLGADPNVLTDAQVSPLHVAVAKGGVGVVRALLDAGANTDCRMAGGLDAVQVAAGMGLYEVLEELLRRGAAPSFRALYGAVLKGRHEAARMLTREMIRRGENVNPCNRAGVSPLHVAAGRGDVRMVEVLLAAGADVHAAPQFDLSRLSAYRRPGGYVMSLQAAWGRRILATPLQLAAGLGHAPVVRALLAAGARIDGSVPLWLASLRWFFSCNTPARRARPAVCAARPARLQASMSVSDPLEIAIRRGHAEVVRTLVAHGAQVAASDQRTGRSMLELCVETGREPVLRALLESGQLTEPVALAQALMAARSRGQAGLVALLQEALEARAPLAA